MQPPSASTVSRQITWIAACCVPLISFLGLPRQTSAENNRTQILPTLGVSENADPKLAATRETEATIANLSKVIKQDSKAGYAYEERACAFFRIGKYKEGFRDFATAIKLNPQSGSAYELRGTALYHVGMYSDAVEDLTLALRIEAQNFGTYIVRALSLNHLGRFDEARADVDKAMQFNPRGNLALELTEALLCVGSPEKALAVIRNVDAFAYASMESQLRFGYYELLASKMLGLECGQLESDLSEKCDKVRRILPSVLSDWNFKEIDFWLSTGELNPEFKVFATKTTNRLKSLHRIGS